MWSIVSFTLRVLCVICFVKSILSEESNEGRCPNITGAQDFNLSKLLGHWYGIQHRNFEDVRCFELFCQSVVERNLTYSLLHRDESGAEVRQNLIDILHLDEPATVDGYILNEDETLSWETWVYFYADSQSCFGIAKCHDSTGSEVYDDKHHHKVTLIIFCRTLHPSVEVLHPVFDEIKKQGLDTYKMKNYDHKNCPKYESS